jgi:hypothetical protein
MSTKIEYATLKNGDVVPIGVVWGVSGFLRIMQDRRDMLLVTVIALARSETTEVSISDRNRQDLRKMQLLNDESRMPRTVRSIILSSLEGEGVHTRLVSPIAGEEAADA